MISEIFIAVLAVVLWIIYCKKIARHPRFPPGPTPFPVVGNIPQFLIGGPFTELDKLKHKYGNILGVQLGSHRSVILSDYQMIKDAFESPAFSGRPPLLPLLFVGGPHKRGLVASEGAVWSEQRRFALRNLRDFGFGKNSMDTTIQESVVDLIASFTEEGGQPIAIERRFNTAIIGALWHIMAGEKFDYGDPRFQKILDGINGALSPALGTVIFLPWLAKIAPEAMGWNKFKTAATNAKALIKTYIVDHLQTFQEDNLRDFMDIYIHEIKATTDPNSSFHKEDGEDNLLVSTLNLFVAGAETTSTTLHWALVCLVMHPEILDKLYTEIEQVIGISRLPSLDDKAKCIYTEAVMQEVLRFSAIVPFGVFHNTMEDVEFHDYFIPKNTMVVANLYGYNHDKAVWGDPENFRPDRFLSLDGKSIVKDIPILSFSVGKRVCLGEILARNEFFLFLTSLVQQFHITADPSDPNHNLDIKMSIIRTPKLGRLIFNNRHK